MIISFSGIDSAGKTTQINLLNSYCIEHGLTVKKVWSKARGTPGVMFLKRLVRRDKKLDDRQKEAYRKAVYSNPLKEKMLYVASMLDLCWYWGIYYRILGFYYDFLICDRYLWDTYIEIKNDFIHIDIDNSFLWKVVQLVTPNPKHSFVFMVPAAISLQRDKTKDADGIETLERKNKKISMYISCIKNKCWSNIMDGTKPINVLYNEVKNILKL